MLHFAQIIAFPQKADPGLVTSGSHGSLNRTTTLCVAVRQRGALQQLKMDRGQLGRLGILISNTAQIAAVSVIQTYSAQLALQFLGIDQS